MLNVLKWVANMLSVFMLNIVTLSVITLIVFTPSAHVPIC